MALKKKKTAKKAAQAGRKGAKPKGRAKKAAAKKKSSALKKPKKAAVSRKAPARKAPSAAKAKKTTAIADTENPVEEAPRPSIPIEPDGTVLTLHPAGKQGTRITFEKYEEMRNMIRKILSRGEMTFMELLHSAEKELAGNFEGSISWYATTVKLDLEARGEIICERGRGEQMLRLP